MRKVPNFLKLLGISIVMLALGTGAFAAEDNLRIGPEELKANLDQPGLTVVDARIVSDWRKSGRKISGAVREDPHNVSAWADKFSKHELLVVYCS